MPSASVEVRFCLDGACQRELRGVAGKHTSQPASAALGLSCWLGFFRPCTLSNSPWISRYGRVMPVSGCYCFESSFRACFSCAGLTHTQSQQARLGPRAGGDKRRHSLPCKHRRECWGHGAIKGARGRWRQQRGQRAAQAVGAEENGRGVLASARARKRGPRCRLGFSSPCSHASFGHRDSRSATQPPGKG